MKNELLLNLEKIHSTVLGVERIKRNLGINNENIVLWCKQKIENADTIIRRGKNWYVYFDDVEITVNAHSFTIITVHREKKKKVDMSN